MADKRKLQCEIDRTLKKIVEGIEIFDDMWTKVHSAVNCNVKEKHEAELKKEIKKLQRLRDFVKSWLTSNEIKDKNILLEHKKLIENKMEQFKVIERETKTKAYSTVGLGTAVKVDPKEKEKDDIRTWLSNQIDALKIQVDQIECSIEAIISKKKKLDSEKQEQVDNYRSHLEQHRFHIGRLELTMRLVDNDAIDIQLINKIKESVEYYVSIRSDPASLSSLSAPDADDSMMYLYDELNLDEESEALGSKLLTRLGNDEERSSETSDLGRESLSSPINTPPSCHSLKVSCSLEDDERPKMMTQLSLDSRQTNGVSLSSSSTSSSSTTTTTTSLRSSSSLSSSSSSSHHHHHYHHHKHHTDGNYSKSNESMATPNAGGAASTTTTTINSFDEFKRTLYVNQLSTESPPNRTTPILTATNYAKVASWHVNPSSNRTSSSTTTTTSTSSTTTTTSMITLTTTNNNNPTTNPMSSTTVVTSAKEPVSMAMSLKQLSISAANMKSGSNSSSSSNHSSGSGSSQSNPSSMVMMINGQLEVSNLQPGSITLQSLTNTSGASTTTTTTTINLQSSSGTSSSFAAGNNNTPVPTTSINSTTLQTNMSSLVNNNSSSSGSNSSNGGNSSSSSNFNNYPFHLQPPSSNINSVTTATNNNNNPLTISSGQSNHSLGCYNNSSPSSLLVSSQPAPTKVIRLHPLLGVAPLGTQPMDRYQRHQRMMLEAVSNHIPCEMDSEQIRLYLQRSPQVTPPYYQPTNHMPFDSIDFFNQLHIETLFFVFYFMEGTKAQHLAAKALKLKSWRFHTKCLMWFQRFEEPKVINEDYEQGSYLYFDFEAWTQKQREEFTFEYKYLEDHEL